jgi:cellulose synthase/poly-beta-1,6-N-acetylglucosamine synthase-like glycosyltransferase
MDKYITILISVLLIINILFYYLLIQKKKKTITFARGAVLSLEELSKYAKTIAIDHNISREIDPNTYPIKKINDDFLYITDTYEVLNESINNKVPIPPSGEWLLDNYYIIEEQVNSLNKELTLQEYYNLPAVSGLSRIYILAKELVAHSDGNIDENIIETFISAYQDKKTLSMTEIWVLPIMLRIALIENIKFICEKIYNSQLQKFKVESIIERNIENKTQGEQRFSEYKNIIVGAEATAFIEHMIYSLKKYGREAYEYVLAVEEEVNKVGTSTSELIREEHFDLALRRVSMGNSILSIKNVSRFDWTKIFEKINEIEKILEQDEYYKKSDFNTRSMYREYIQDIAQKANVSEMYVAVKVIECMNNSGGTHIGYYIIDEGKDILLKKLGYELSIKDKLLLYIKSNKTALYIFMIYVSTLILSIIFAKQYFWLAFFPISEIVVLVYNKILCIIIKARLLPSLENVPENIKTFVVVPTLLNNTKRVKDLVEKLEVYYLGNKIDNIAFALLGDVSEVSSEKMEYDKEIMKVGEEEVKKLNNKYGKEIFFFLYRRRVFNEKQNKWLGYERKRGMLTEFNNFLQTGEKGTFQINTINKNLEELKSYKYVITLDADTALTLDAAKKLICIMEHPLNAPIVKEKTVVKGYGIIQPKVGISIEAATCSKFAKIFAGSGGIDMYSTAESNIYQDVFGEAIFTGKGIYNVSIFQQLLKHEIPENTVLSHDLLERKLY